MLLLAMICAPAEAVFAFFWGDAVQDRKEGARMHFLLAGVCAAVVVSGLTVKAHLPLAAAAVMAVCIFIVGSIFGFIGWRRAA